MNEVTANCFISKDMRSLIERLNMANIDATADRWSAGLPHHPDAEKIARTIGNLDFMFFGDSFELKFGGDGDSGETLAYILDVYFDLLDAEKKINAN